MALSFLKADAPYTARDWSIVRLVHAGEPICVPVDMMLL